jgi:hypothetical protein
MTGCTYCGEPSEPALRPVDSHADGMLLADRNTGFLNLVSCFIRLQTELVRETLRNRLDFIRLHAVQSEKEHALRNLKPWQMRQLRYRSGDGQSAATVRAKHGGPLFGMVVVQSDPEIMRTVDGFVHWNSV